MRHLTAHGYLVAAIALVVLGLCIGWPAGRAYQRAIDAWFRFVNHLRMTRYMFRTARLVAFNALGTLSLAALVLVGAVAAVWMLLT
jgi:hypothetical protein